MGLQLKVRDIGQVHFVPREEIELVDCDSREIEEIRGLREEFEDGRTPEARLAHSLDRLQPILNNYYTDGKSWRANGITRRQVRDRNRILSEGAPPLWDYIEDLLQRAVERGFLKA